MSRSCGIPDLIRIKNESHLGMDGTRGDRSRLGGARSGPAPCCLDGKSSSGVSRDEQKQGHPVHQDEYFQVRSFTASDQQRRPVARINAQRGGSQEPSRSDAGSPHRTGAASPERDPPTTLQLGSVQTRGERRISHTCLHRTSKSPTPEMIPDDLGE